MKFAGATLFAAAASAAAIKGRADNLSYTVGSFYASCIPHSTQCSYSFHTKASHIPQEADCSWMGGSDGTLPAVSLQTCSNKGYTFSVYPDAEGNPGGLSLEINTPNTSGAGTVSGLKVMPASMFTTTSTGSGSVEAYTGPQNFTVPAQIVFDH
ncbi:hypothetical protein F4780DRAFT_130925 [Xylariomycetidae sp. FL0641]|nr:hypothetical protein F4780DRAFT_130925 [Xylariomycetidae sp. FL0641]